MGRSFVRRRAGWVAAALTVAAVGCGGDSPTNPGGGGGGGGPTVTTSVAVGPGNSFSPADIQVSAGATVTWTFAGGTHNVTFSSPSISSGDRSSGTFPAVMPTTPGTYNYSCTLHSGMNGSVLVVP